MSDRLDIVDILCDAVEVGIGDATADGFGQTPAHLSLSRVIYETIDPALDAVVRVSLEE